MRNETILNIEEYHKKKIFKPIRNKIDLINILITSMGIIIYNYQYRDNILSSTEKIIFMHDNMQRIYFCSKEKIYSITFPFTIITTENELYFSNYKVPKFKINAIIVEYLKEFFSNSAIENADFLELWLEFTTEKQLKGEVYNCMLMLIITLLECEPGYLRYDHDIEHADAKTHPEHHLDIYYSNSLTFKLGIRHAIDHQSMASIIKNTEAVQYIDYK